MICCAKTLFLATTNTRFLMSLSQWIQFLSETPKTTTNWQLIDDYTKLIWHSKSKVIEVMWARKNCNIIFSQIRRHTSERKHNLYTSCACSLLGSPVVMNILRRNNLTILSFWHCTNLVDKLVGHCAAGRSCKMAFIAIVDFFAFILVNLLFKCY